MQAYIKGSGMHVPGKVVPNSYFNEILGEDVDTWLRENLTIEERRWCSADESVADLCVEAAGKAMDNSGVKADEIDLLIIATDTPEYISPSTASVVQERLGTVNAGTFDINTACAGFVTAITTATMFLNGDENIKNVLVIGAYAMSKYLDLNDKKTVTLFADGAGAVVMGKTDEEGRGYRYSKLKSDGQYNGWMGIYAGATHQPATAEVVENKDHLLKFVKKFPKELNPQVWSEMIIEGFRKTGWSAAEVDHYLFTQININSIWATLDILGADRKKGHTIMSKYGYTGSACIPMALDDLNQKGLLKRGDKIVFMGSGGGLAFATAFFEW